MNSKDGRSAHQGRILESLSARFLHFGIAYGDLKRLSAHNGECGNWSKFLAEQAARYEALGDDAWQHRRLMSAREWWRRAVDYYHFAQLRLDDGHHKCSLQASSRRNFSKLVLHVEPNIARLEIPFDGTSLPGYFRIATEGAPCVILIGGLDSAKEVELCSFAQYFLNRGNSVFFFDGPGQGELCGTTAMTAHFENVVSTVIDYLLTHRLAAIAAFALFGVSFGGYLACRAAAVDDRVAACVSLGGFFDSRIVGRMLPFARAALRRTFGLTEQDSLEDTSAQITLEPLRGRMDKPLLIVHGSEDHLVDEEQAHGMAAWAHGPKSLWIIQGAEHVCTDRFPEVLPSIGDWVTETVRSPSCEAIVPRGGHECEVSRFESHS